MQWNGYHFFLVITHESVKPVIEILTYGFNSYPSDDILKCIFLTENVWISNTIWLKFYPKVPIDNKTALFQIMACRRKGDKPLSEPMMA